MSASAKVKSMPILFSAAMVRAILDGRKTQTRRVMKPQPEYRKGKKLAWAWGSREWAKDYNPSDHCQSCSFWGSHCPYGKAGDRLWVRETWTPDHEPFYPHFPICYRADFGPEYEREHGKVFSSEQNAWFPFRWRPAIHMPRIKSRITLEITGVRVERLNDISEEDATAEGVRNRSDLAWGHGGAGDDMARWAVDHGYRFGFREVWESINGVGSWAANPWVWVIEFKRV